MSEGARAYLGLGYEIAKGIPGPVQNWVPFQSESINPTPSSKPNPNINPRRSAQKKRVFQIAIAGGTVSAPDAESQARLRAHHQGKVVTTALDAPNSVYQHVLTPLFNGDPEEAVYRRTLSGIVYRDDGMPMQVMGGVATNMNLAVAENEYVSMTHELMFENFTESDSPVAAAANNAAFTGSAFIRGTRRDADLGINADPIYMLVVTTGALDGSAPIPQVKFKIGGVDPLDPGFAAEFTGPAVNIALDSWADAWDDTVSPIGPDFTLPYQVLFHTDDPTDVLTLGDAWTIAPSIDIVSPSYTTREVYDFGQAEALIGGNRYVLNSFTLNGTNPRMEDRGIGSRFAQQMLDNGEINWTVEIARKYVDRTFVNAIRANKTVAFRCTLRGAQIGVSEYRDSHDFYLRMCQYDEVATNVANQGVMEERIVLGAFDPRTDPICEETIVNSIPVI